MPVTATVAYFEDENVRLLVGESEFVVSRSELPEDVGQGDVLRLEFKMDHRTMKDADIDGRDRPGEEH